MKVFKYRPPYQKNGKTNFPETRERTGVYLIKEDGKLVYIGYSGNNLYRTMYRHFQAWDDKTKQYRVSYAGRLGRHKYTVRVVYCTPLQAVELEFALIIKHHPRDNENKYKAHSLAPGLEKVIEDYQFTPVEGSAAPF